MGKFTIFLNTHIVFLRWRTLFTHITWIIFSCENRGNYMIFFLELSRIIFSCEDISRIENVSYKIFPARFSISQYMYQSTHFENTMRKNMLSKCVYRFTAIFFLLWKYKCYLEKDTKYFLEIFPSVEAAHELDHAKKLRIWTDQTKTAPLLRTKAKNGQIRP